MFKMNGLDELSRNLKELDRRARELDRKHSAPLSELFPPEFMRRNTDFGSIDEMLEKSGFKVEEEEDFGKIPDAEWNSFVAQHTRFASWVEMMGSGGAAWTAKKLGF